MRADTIVVPEAEPAYEWVRDRALQKMSPSRRHAVLQGSWYRILTDWAGDRGWSGTEWRFVITPPGEDSRPLVPDVAYIGAERLAALPEEAREYPPLAPDIVVEILSPGDRAIDVDHKRDVYRAAGTTLILIVDPMNRTIEAFERDESPRRYAATETFRSTAFPDLLVDLSALFGKLDRPG
jgi:Uma2 family endonuclease